MLLKTLLLLTLILPAFGNSIQVAKQEGVTTAEEDAAITDTNTEDIAEGAEDPSYCRCRFYRHCHYKGVSKCFNYSSYYVGRWHNDEFSSVKVAKGYACRGYEHKGYKGRYVTFYANDRCFTNNYRIGWWRSWNDVISSIKVYRYYACPCRLYQHCGYKGFSRCYRRSTPYFRWGHNDKYSSIRVAKGYKCKVHEHNWYRGKSFTFTRNDRCFVNNRYWKGWMLKSFNDKASSITVKRRHTWTGGDATYAAAGAVGLLSFAGLGLFIYKKRAKTQEEYEALVNTDV